MSKRTTSGIEWLAHSMASFNGSGYADKQSPEHKAQAKFKKYYQPEGVHWLHY